MNKTKRILLSICIMTAVCLNLNIGHANTKNADMETIGHAQTVASPSDASAQTFVMDADELPALCDLPSDNFAVEPTGRYVNQIISGIGSYFSETHNLLTCVGSGASGMAAYCIEPSKTAPSSASAYTEIGMNTTASSSLAEKAGAAAILMYGYGGQSSINNYIFNLSEPNPNMGGSFGTYVIDGVGYTGLLINGSFFRMSALEAHAVTAAVIHRLNGSPITSITGSRLSDDSDIVTASEYLYSLGSYSRLNTATNGWDSTNSFLQAFTQPSRNLQIEIQTQSGEWTTMPADCTNVNFDWSPYTIQGNITLRIKYTAFRCESKLIKSVSQSGTQDNLTYEHEAMTTFPSNTAGNGYYDYFNVNTGNKNTIPIHVTYGKLSSAKCSTIRLGIIDPAYGGFPPCDGVQFQQTATVTFSASDIAQGKTLDLNVTAPEAAGHTPYYGDGDGKDGSYVAGRFFAAPGYQDIAVASPNMTIPACTASIYIKHAAGILKLHKNSSLTEITSGNSRYSLEGAIYGIYTNQADAGAHTNPVATMCTDADGNAAASELAFGTYYIAELSAPPGYQIDTTIYSATINSDTPVQIEVTDAPYADTTHILLYKKGDNEIPLAHACFTVKYYDTVADTDPALANLIPKKTWFFESGDDGYVYLDSTCQTGGDTLYYDIDGNAVLPLGTITIQETSAPEGYLIDETIYTYQITDTTTEGTPHNSEHERIFVNQEIKQAFQLIKYGETPDSSKQPLVHAGFQACRLDTLDIDTEGNYIWDSTKAVILTEDGSAELYTDENGYACSIPLSYGIYVVRETFVPENYLPIDDFLVYITEDSEEPQTMRYFTDRSFKAYLRILKCDSNSGQLIQNNPATFRIWSYDSESYINFTWNDEDGPHSTCELQTDNNGTCITPSPLFPGKYAICEISEPGGYYNLTPNTPVDFEITDTGFYEAYLSETGDMTDMGIFTCTIYNTPLNGQIEIYKTGDTRKWNTEIMAFDTTEIPLENIRFDIIADDTIYSPDGQGTILYEAGTIVETITTNTDGYAISSDTLPLGCYIIRETVPDGYEPIEDIPVTLSSDGTILEQVQGETIIQKVIDSLTVHNTLLIPELHTTARDTSTGTNTGIAQNDSCIIDTIEYYNLIPGESYTIQGILMDQETEAEAFIHGQPVTSDISFIPENTNGTVEIPFFLDSTSLAGKDVVLYETLYRDNEIVAVHTDINNKQQTITYPQTPDAPRTGDESPVIALITLGVLSLLSLFTIIHNRHKS